MSGTRTEMLAAAVGAAVLAVTLAGCSSSSTPTLHVAGGNLTPSRNHIGGELSMVLRTGRSDAEPAGDVCTNAGPVRVTSVELHNPTGGIHLDAWGIDNAHADNEGGVSTLARMGTYTSRTVTRKCDGHADDDADVGVQVSRRGTASGYTEGFDVTYEDSSGHHTVWLGFGVKVRAPK